MSVQWRYETGRLADRPVGPQEAGLKGARDLDRLRRFSQEDPS